MWTSLNAVETESAVEVSDLARLKQRELTAALNHHERRFCGAGTANAVFRSALSTHIVIAHGDFERRHSRGDKIELADRANELAKCRMFENRVDQQRARKEHDDQPRSPPGRRPKIEPLVNKKHDYKQADREPLVAQTPWPVPY